MKYRLLVILIPAILLFHAHQCFAECVVIGSVVSWSFIDNRTIIIYRGSKPAALVKTSACFIKQTSDIRLIEGRVCSQGKLIIDGKPCTIQTVSPNPDKLESQ